MKILKIKFFFIYLYLRNPLIKIRAYVNNFRWGKDVLVIGFNNIKNLGRVEIGDRTVITINNRRVRTYALFTRDACIGKDNFLTVGRRIYIGSQFYSSSNCFMLCATHNYSDPTVPYKLAQVIANSTIWIQDNVFLGANVRIIGGVKIGFGSFINADTTILKNIPPLSYVTGSPAKILKRYNWNEKKWVDADRFDASSLPSYYTFKRSLKKGSGAPNPYSITSRNGWI
jgi:acetyltransferase-like isoleucine patch superfamily enzyme